ncbi:MAG: FtsQ-type POTRA domain-containing protein [Methylophilaceae bacterium]|nr:FtsQ-type POTRA domain-containing protein [Methylophilaceae bacterium]
MWNRPQLLNWTANFLFSLSVVLMLYALLFVVVHLPIFPLREVNVNGELSHVNREQIKLIVARHLNGNFFTLDLIKARDAFEKLPWARKVSVRRRWPDKLEVVIEEHEALGRWGDIALVNNHGELFHAASDSDLPVFFGPADGVLEVAQSYSNYSKVLNVAQLKVTQVALSPRRAWEVKTDKGLLINIGREHMDERLQKFVGAYASTLARLNGRVIYADLRYPNGFAVRRPLGQVVKNSVVVKAVVKAKESVPATAKKQPAKTVVLKSHEQGKQP